MDPHLCSCHLLLLSFCKLINYLILLTWGIPKLTIIIKTLFIITICIRIIRKLTIILFISQLLTILINLPQLMIIIKLFFLFLSLLFLLQPQSLPKNKLLLYNSLTLIHLLSFLLLLKFEQLPVMFHNNLLLLDLPSS